MRIQHFPDGSAPVASSPDEPELEIPAHSTLAFGFCGQKAG
jgi:hypothetical protein